MNRLSLRARMGVAAGVAVALAVIAVAVSAYAGTRSELRGQVDAQLQQRLQGLLAGPGGPGGPGDRRGTPGGAPRTAPVQSGAAPSVVPQTDCDRGLGIDRSRRPFGGATAVVQAVAPNGTRCSVPGQGDALPVDPESARIARSGSGSHLTDMHVRGTHIRVLTAGLGPGGGALEVALPVSDVDHALRSQVLLLLAIAAAGIALAALLGILVARTALAPIARFTRRTEAIASEPERLDQRLEVAGDDELARLARTFNTTLDSLGRSIDAQRNLVADASHELRTPIATLRANLQLLLDEDRLTAADRAALREDMITELDELTSLVSDVVELARGAKPSGKFDDVRLDRIAAELVERTRRRAPELSVHVELEPTLVRGDAERIGRAIANLLDNARKWSPPASAIQVSLRDGSLAVRDHGPGFHDEDLPFVFDRFHRARDARGKPGSGLGLAIVRQEAEAHGGYARAANAPGGGALVTVSFGPHSAVAEPPPDDELSAAAAASASRPAGTSGGSGRGTPGS